MNITTQLTIIADQLHQHYNPCHRHGPHCLAGPNPCCTYTRYKRPDGDPHCTHLGPNGCQHPNLKCKLWYCRTALEHMPPDLLQILHKLEQIAQQHNLIEPPYLGQRYVGHSKY